VFEELVTGLESNTVYVFRAGARNQNGEHWGGYQVFTTE